jgi:hypothetical protein
MVEAAFDALCSLVEREPRTAGEMFYLEQARRPERSETYARTMKTSYSVTWHDPEGKTHVGHLELGAKSLRLTESGDRNPIEIGYDELQGVSFRYVEKAQPSLVLYRPGGSYVLTSTVMEAGVVPELVGHLAEMGLPASRRAIVVLPLKEGALEHARELAAKGPPFDPAVSGLTRHRLLLTSHEAIFEFESSKEGALEALLGLIDLWAAAEAWRDLIAGPPRLAEVAYAWERMEPTDVAIGLGL